MYPTSTLVATVTADRQRQAETARQARAARHHRSRPSWRSRWMRAAVTRLAAVAAAHRNNAENERARA